MEAVLDILARILPPTTLLWLVVLAVVVVGIYFFAKSALSYLQQADDARRADQKQIEEAYQKRCETCPARIFQDSYSDLVTNYRELFERYEQDVKGRIEKEERDHTGHIHLYARLMRMRTILIAVKCPEDRETCVCREGVMEQLDDLLQIELDSYNAELEDKDEDGG